MSSRAAASRRILAKAADALAQFRLVAGVPPPPETSLRSELEQTRERAARAEALVEALRERGKLMEAELVRLRNKRKESLRHMALHAMGDAEAAGRPVVETLRQELLAAGASLALSAAELARVKKANETLESGKRLEVAHVAGEASAMAMEMERAAAVAAALRAELAAAGQEKEALRRDMAAIQKDLVEARSAASSNVPLPIPGEEADWLEPRGGPPPGEEVLPPPAPIGERSFVQPSLEPVLDPGWARLLRLVRPPVEAAYAHLRRLSATVLTAGQTAVLRMSAASVAQACDALTTIELALEEGPAPGRAAPALPVLETSLAAWEPAFRRRGVVLARDFSSGPLPDAAHDAKALRVLLHHVFGNVLEALPRGGRLTVRAWRGPDGGLRFEFLDDGPGFPPQWLERCFEPFAAPRRGRAGLGLSLVRRTLRRWGGDAEAGNGPSGGARLTLIFASAAAS